MWKDGRWYEFIDQSFGDEYEPGEMMKCLVVALMCVQEKAVERPTMSDVVAMLSSDDITLPEPRQPAYSHIRVDVSVDANVTCSRNDITITATDVTHGMLLLSLLVLFISCSAPSVGQELCHDYNGAMYMPDSTYKSNLISLAATLIANATELNSATGMVGTGPDKVYGAVFCRGDSEGSDCHKRLTKALDTAINSKNRHSYSPQNKNVYYYYDQDQAQIHFSNQDFLSSFNNVPECMVNTNLNAVPASVVKQLDFEDLVTNMLRALTDAAASREERYAVGRQRFEETGQIVYGLVQCMRNMPSEHCMACLDGIISDRPNKVSTAQMGAAILGVWCTLRYETDTQFFSNTNMLLLDVLKKSEHTGKKAFFRKENTALVSIGGFILVVFISCLLFHIWIKTQQQREQAIFKLRQLSLAIKTVIYLWRTEGTNSDYFLYNFSKIKEATNNFSIDNKLGHGGFGPVYKVIMHLHYYSLFSTYDSSKSHPIVFDQLCNNLVHVLADCVKGAQLNWPKRLRIIDGIAQGILYLHNHSRLCVVHRDLKASNILLDSDMTPKISDFGMARIFCSNMIESNTTRIVGTQTTSFYPYDEKLYNLISYAWQLWRSGRCHELVCFQVGDDYQMIQRCIQVALLCVQERADDRPAIDQAVTMLNSEEMTLPKPKQPAYFYVRSVASEVSSCDNSISITLAR
ncbi:hypothetical protein ABZP36_000439 [Zizania latifolia]